jgi:hypothetical protein
VLHPGRAPSSHSIWGQEDTRTSVDTVEKRKISWSCPGLNPRHPAHSLSLLWVIIPPHMPAFSGKYFICIPTQHTLPTLSFLIQLPQLCEACSYIYFLHTKILRYQVVGNQCDKKVVSFWHVALWNQAEGYQCSKKQAAACLMHGLFFDPDNIGTTFFQNSAKINSITFQNKVLFTVKTVKKTWITIS